MRGPGFAVERGSMAPLGIGLFAISLSFLLTTVSAGSMFVFQKRLTNYAEMVALFVVDKDASVSDFQRRAGDQEFEQLSLSEQLLEDGKTVRVTACATWTSPVLSTIEVLSTTVCSKAAARFG